MKRRAAAVPAGWILPLSLVLVAAGLLAGSVAHATSNVIVTSRNGLTSEFSPDGSFLSHPPAIDRSSQLELVGDEIWATGFIDSSGVLRSAGGYARFDASTYAFIGSFGLPGGNSGDLLFTGTEVLISGPNGVGARRFSPDGTYLGNLTSFAPVSQLELVGNEIWGTGFVDNSGVLRGSGGVIRYDATNYSVLGSFGLPGGASGDLLFTGTEVLVSGHGTSTRRVDLSGNFLGYAPIGAVAQFELVGDEIWGTGFVDSSGVLQGGNTIARWDATTYQSLGGIGVPGGTSGDLLAIPEPGTALLLGLGLGVLAAPRRRSA